MSFANPWMLLGLSAALLPLVIHLLNRRRPRTQPFPAITLLLRSQRRTARQLRLRRILLYAARTLLLLTIPLALARPTCGAAPVDASESRGPAATAIVLDASLSMRWGDPSLFSEAQRLARAALGRLGPGEPVTVLVCDGGTTPPPTPGLERAELRELIDSAEVGYAAADVSACLDRAASVLEESPVPGKRIILASDLTEASLRLERPPPTVEGPDGEPVRPEVILLDAADDRALPNRALVELEVERAPEIDAAAFRFDFIVRNHAPEAVSDLEAVLSIDGRPVAKTFLDLAPGGSARKSLVHRFEEGGPVRASVRLAPDALIADDVRELAFEVPKRLSALVVNGSPKGTRYLDEAFFVEAALNAPGSPVVPIIRDAQAGLGMAFDEHDVVFLLNVPAPTAEEAERLADFVRAGGGLFISVGDNVDPDAYNERLGALLPNRLRLVKSAAGGAGDAGAADGGAGRAARIERFEIDHPVFAPFEGVAREGLLSARFERYMLLEPSSRESARVLGNYEDGAPLMATTDVGDGRVLLLTTSVDRDWSDLAIRVSFLPLMHRASAFLARSLDDGDVLRAEVGELLTLEAGRSADVSSARAPSGAEVPIERLADGRVRVGPLPEPGILTLLDSADRALKPLAISVTLPAAESDLEPIPVETLQRYFGEATVRSGEGAAERSEVPLWTWLLALGAIAFFAEGLLVQQRPLSIRAPTAQGGK